MRRDSFIRITHLIGVIIITPILSALHYKSTNLRYCFGCFLTTHLTASFEITVQYNLRKKIQMGNDFGRYLRTQLMLSFVVILMGNFYYYYYYWYCMCFASSMITEKKFLICILHRINLFDVPSSLFLSVRLIRLLT